MVNSVDSISAPISTASSVATVPGVIGMPNPQKRIVYSIVEHLPNKGSFDQLTRDLTLGVKSYLNKASTFALTTTSKNFYTESIESCEKTNSRTILGLLLRCGGTISKLSSFERERLLNIGARMRSFQLDAERPIDPTLLQSIPSIMPHLTSILGIPVNAQLLTAFKPLCSQLRAIDFRDAQCRTTDPGAFLKSCPHLEKLALKDFHLSDVIPQLRELKVVTSLSLDDCSGLDPQTIHTLAEQFPGLKELRLKHVNYQNGRTDWHLWGVVGDMLEPMLVGALSKLQNLEELEIDSSGMSDQILQEIGKLTKLKHLSLNHMEFISDQGIRELEPLSLRTLEFYSFPNSDGVSTAAMDHFFVLQPHLETFRITIDDKEIDAEKLRGLGNCENISELNLSDVRGWEGAQGSWISSLSNLTRLKLSSCEEIGKDTLEALAKIGKLRELVLSGTGLTLDALDAGEALPQVTRLELSGLRPNHYGNAKILGVCPGVEILQISPDTEPLHRIGIARIEKMKKLQQPYRPHNPKHNATNGVGAQLANRFEELASRAWRICELVFEDIVNHG